MKPGVVLTEAWIGLLVDLILNSVPFICFWSKMTFLVLIQLRRGTKYRNYYTDKIELTPHKIEHHKIEPIIQWHH